MAYAEQFHFVVTVPAGTAQASPLVTELEMPVRAVTRISWQVPPGPQGLMGFLVGARSVPIVPQPAGTYQVADGQSGSWDIDGHHDSGDWSCIAYNTGSFSHSVRLTFFTHLLDKPAQPRFTYEAPMLAPVPDLSHAGPPVRRGSWRS